MLYVESARSLPLIVAEKENISRKLCMLYDTETDLISSSLRVFTEKKELKVELNMAAAIKSP